MCVIILSSSFFIIYDITLQKNLSTHILSIFPLCCTQYTRTRGAKFLYDSFLKDFLKSNESKIDAALKDAKSSAGKVASEAKKAASEVADNVKKSTDDKKDE